jgi:hypothetical protein
MEIDVHVDHTDSLNILDAFASVLNKKTDWIKSVPVDRNNLLETLATHMAKDGFYKILYDYVDRANPLPYDELSVQELKKMFWKADISRKNILLASPNILVKTFSHCFNISIKVNGEECVIEPESTFTINLIYESDINILLQLLNT